jgi:hypothetical protein
VEQKVAELLAHSSGCTCGRCEAAATAREGHMWAVAVGWKPRKADTRPDVSPPAEGRSPIRGHVWSSPKQVVHYSCRY